MTKFLFFIMSVCTCLLSLIEAHEDAIIAAILTVAFAAIYIGERVK